MPSAINVSAKVGFMSGSLVVRGACPHDCPDTCALLTTVEDGVSNTTIVVGQSLALTGPDQNPSWRNPFTWWRASYPKLMGHGQPLCANFKPPPRQRSWANPTSTCWKVVLPHALTLKPRDASPKNRRGSNSRK